MKNPCAKCKDTKRYPGCHGHCDEEAAYKEWAKPKNDKTKASRREDADYMGFKIERIEFCKRRAGVE